MGEEREREGWEVNGKGCFSLFCVCVCIKNGKGRVVVCWDGTERWGCL